jgi:hypothetical protein
MLDRNAVRSAPGPSRLGLFGMVSAAALERLADRAAAAPACTPAAAMGVYAQLAVLASQQGTASAQGGQRCTVTIAELAARCRMGRRTVQTYLALIADCGLVAIDHRYDVRGRPLASTLVFAYPDRHAPASSAPPAAVTPPAAHHTAGGPDSAVESGAVAGGAPRDSRAAGGAQYSERGEEREVLVEPGRGLEDARAYLHERFGWKVRCPGDAPPPGALRVLAGTRAGAGSPGA